MAKTRLDEIQVFRGLAAILVIIYHASFLSKAEFGAPFLGGAFSFGFSGVDFFFVLSGFIITYMHLGDIGGSGKLIPYTRKRFLRVYPIYWVLTLAVIPMYFLNPGFGNGYETSPTAILTSLALIPQDHYPILGVAWSLCHEVKFYLLFGIAIVAGRKVAAVLGAAILGVTTVYYGLELGGFPVSGFGEAIGFLFSRYNLEFAAGCLCAYLATKTAIARPGLLRMAGIAAFAAAAALNPMLLALDEHHSVLTFGLASALLVAGSAALEMRRPAPKPGWLLFLGNASYSIYLSHYLTLSLCGKIALKTGLAEKLGVTVTISSFILIAIGIGCLIHLAIERPMAIRLAMAFRGPEVGTAGDAPRVLVSLASGRPD